MKWNGQCKSLEDRPSPAGLWVAGQCITYVHKNNWQETKSLWVKKTSVSHQELLTSSIMGHFCFPYQGCGQETKKTTATYTGMLRQHSSITKGGNGTVSLLTGKSCHSLPKRHSSFPLKMQRVLLTALRLISDSRGMHAIWICDRARVCMCNHTLAGMHRLRDVSWAAAGRVCVQTQSVNSYWMGGGEATWLKGMRGRQEGESEEVTMEHDCRLLLTSPIITLTVYPILSTLGIFS